MGQPPIPPTPAGTSLTGQTVIVTGGNAGLGLEAARQYITLNASRVILACRSISKGEEAAKYLSTHPTVKSTNPGVEIRVMALDLDDETSVVNFASKVKKELDALDVLLLNGVNYHSNALLALELLPLLESTASQRGQPSRLTFVGSSTHKMHSLNKTPMEKEESVTHRWDDKERYRPMQRYSDSKLMVAAFTQELARHVDPSKVIVNNLCPGMVSTGLNVNLPLWLKPIMWLLRLIRAGTPEVGARTYVYATSVAGTESHGKWLQHNKVAETDVILTESQGQTLMQKAWAEALESAKKLDPSFSEALI
ncbi:hypothetical protein JMJ35_006610 [Cladonia borealis]|uniref:Short-chain dehydrogenase/reductase n=1 Tax=Cladonia borealis TaxID=184061 RepID=A0AA39R0F6_9LECA|nr:hypothetical protein JMJ35_006610 [Cladonia borealis]